MPKKGTARKSSAPSPKQVAARQHQPITLTLTIDDPAALVQQGTMVLKRGDVAIVRAARWSNSLQLADVVRAATHQLLETERDPMAARRASVEMMSSLTPPEAEPVTAVDDDEIPPLRLTRRRSPPMGRETTCP